MSGDAPVVEAEGLATGYDAGEPALRGVTFAVGPGRIVALLGPNGGGKTTLLRALLGELPALAGRVRLAARTAYVPQNDDTRLDFPVTAADVAAMGAFARIPWWRPLGAGTRRAAADALARVGLEDRAGARYGDLSRGQRQRVLVARALVQDAPVVLLDEPFAGVDASSAERMMALLAGLRDEGRTLLVATHDIDQARRWDLVLCLNGEQVAFGPPAAALDPAALERTYGAEIVLLEGGGQAVAVQHHHHHGGEG